MTIRVFLAVLLGSLAVACVSGSVTKPSQLSRLPTATPQVANPTPTVVFPTVTLEPVATPTVVAALTPEHLGSAPTGKEDENRFVPNPQPPSRQLSGPNEVSRALLTIYNCTGDNGGYCPGVRHTATGTDLVPGTAACDRSYLGRKFVIAGDPTATVWTCLDTGLFSGALFDLWFYDLGAGLQYQKDLPTPYRIVFVG